MANLVDLYEGAIIHPMQLKYREKLLIIGSRLALKEGRVKIGDIVYVKDTAQKLIDEDSSCVGPECEACTNGAPAFYVSSEDPDIIDQYRPFHGASSCWYTFITMEGKRVGRRKNYNTKEK